MQTIRLRAYISSVIILRVLETGCQVLLLKRLGTLDGEWCQVAGKIEDGETAWQGALREVFEETGLTPLRFFSADICEQFYETDRNEIILAPVFVAYAAPDAQIILSPEHSAYRWVSMAEAIEMVPFGGQRKVLRWVHEEFIERTPNRHLEIPLPA